MIIPQHWAEARIAGKVDGRPRIVRRYGWSDDSPEAARHHADERAAAAFAALQQGRPVPARERKVPYGGADGLPIREEVIARHGDLVVTRNSYGARCLNVPDVLFADLDLEPDLPPTIALPLLVVSAVVFAAGLAFAVAAFWGGELSTGCMLLPAAVLVPIALLGLRLRFANRPGNVARCRTRLLARTREVLGAEPRGRFALYETPAGLRVLALHATYEPAGEAAQSLFAALGTDPVYVQMCTLQSCFRARISGKPWRMGVREHVRAGTWPVPAAKAAAREAWIGRYEARAALFAACRFVAEVGDGPRHPRALAVQKVHDAVSRAHTDLPIA